jgi:hypothetical protein
MKSILFYLVFITSTLYAGADERDPASRKRVLVQSVFDEEADKRAEDKKRKYGRSTTPKKGGQKTQRTVNKHVIITQEDRARLTTDPSVYKSPPQDDVLQVALNKKAEVAKQVRHPDFLHQ